MIDNYDSLDKISESNGKGKGKQLFIVSKANIDYLTFIKEVNKIAENLKEEKDEIKFDDVEVYAETTACTMEIDSKCHNKELKTMIGKKARSQLFNCLLIEADNEQGSFDKLKIIMEDNLDEIFNREMGDYKPEEKKDYEKLLKFFKTNKTDQVLGDI
jgi:hypothetical protein